MEFQIYTKISRLQLEHLTECLHYCLDLPVQVLDENGTVFCSYGTSVPFCVSFKQFLTRHSVPKGSCAELHAQACRHAQKSGKPYVFYCHAGLDHLVFPLNCGKKQLGCVLIGPFLTAPYEPETVADIAQRYKLTAIELLSLYDAVNTISIITPEKADQISWLMSYLFSPLLSQQDVIPNPPASVSPTNNSEKIQKGTDTIENAISYIRQHYDKDITLKDTAEYVQLNPSYLSTLFKQRCGTSFKEYLNYIRIEESKKLLSNTDYPILDIAIAVGFEDQSYFTKVFKKYTNMTPKQYRG